MHNLRTAKWGPDAPAYPWATAFNEQLRGALARGDHETAVEYQRLGEAASLSVPTPEHYLPLLYVLGAGSAGDTAAFPTDGIEMGSISMLTVLLQPDE